MLELRNIYVIKNFFIIIVICSLFGCSYNNLKVNRYYRVKKGDTLYSISKKYGVKTEYLAKINDIKNPYNISQGQKLFLIDYKKAQRVFNKRSKSNNLFHKNSNTYSNATNQSYNKSINKQQAKHNGCFVIDYSNKHAANYDKIANIAKNKHWIWPARGKIIKRFIASGPNKGNGVDLAGKKGDPIFSIADGKVVYSGNNLRGYGNLIIIKHDHDFLSAYAHNDKILVKEHQEIKKGQQIATMGDSESNRVLLHFEIRYKGKPVDPEKILGKIIIN